MPWLSIMRPCLGGDCFSRGHPYEDLNISLFFRGLCVSEEVAKYPKIALSGLYFTHLYFVVPYSILCVALHPGSTSRPEFREHIHRGVLRGILYKLSFCRAYLSAKSIICQGK